MSDLNPQEFDGTNMADPPAPEDVPKEYADYLRSQVIAMAHRYLSEYGGEIEPDWAMVEDIAEQTRNLRAWKAEFNLKDID